MNNNSTNSRLKIIEERSFSDTKIKSIQISSSVIKIGPYAFEENYSLSEIEFSANSELQIKILIPPKLTQINKN